MKATWAAVPLLLILALVAWWAVGRSSSEPDESRAPSLLTRYRQELAASRDLADARELDGLRKGRAFLGTLAAGGETQRFELGLMGNLNGYASPCACSNKGRGGGLAVIGAAVRRWRGAGAPSLVDVGDSLLPDGAYPAAYEPLFLEKAQILAQIYRLIGVDVFLPSPTDLRVFEDLGGLTAWSATAGLSSVITNLPASAETDRVQRTVTFGDADFAVALYAVCDPAEPHRRETLARFGLEPLDLTFKRCALPLRGLRLVILHNVPLLTCLDRLPRPLERTIYVVRGLKPHTRDPRVRDLRWRGLIVRPVARGQSVSILHFLAGAEREAVRNAGSEKVLFERTVSRNRGPRPPTRTAIRFLATPIAFREGSEETVGELRAVKETLVAHRTKVLQRLLADPPYAADAVPETRRRLLAQETCGSCHESAVEGWKAGPHAHALTTLLEGERKDQAEAGCIRCHLSATSRLVLDAPARTEDHPLRMRGVLSGITCVTCHADVSDKHLEGTTQEASREAARAVCRRCHDPINSPAFDLATYVQKLGCCGVGRK